MSTSLRFFYFDLGNVLLLFDHQRAAAQMAKVAGIGAGLAWQAVFDSGLEWRFEEGKVTPAEFCREFSALTNSAPPEDQLLHAVADIFTLNSPIEPIVTGLHAAGHRLGILSNTNSVHWDFVRDGRYSLITDCFETHALSFAIGAMKPAAAIYQEAARLAGAKAEQIFFVDDRPENVAGALACGFDAVPFTTAQQLEADLAARGVCWSV